jgi:hypothetical protein
VKFGFAVGQRVRVKRQGFFWGWGGHVRAFGDQMVAVDLDEPPNGERPSGQWFLPESLEAV